MTRVVLQALLSHWWRRPLQLVTLLFGLALATGLWTGVQAINQEARSSYDAAAQALGQGDFDRLVAQGGALIQRQTFVDLRRAGWLVSPVIEGRYGRGEDRVTVIGLDPFTLPPSAGAPDLSDDNDLAQWFSDDGLIFVHPETQAALPDGLPRAIPNLSVAIGEVVTDVTTAWRLLEVDGFSHLIIAPQQPIGLTPLDDLIPSLERVRPDPAGDIAQLTRSFHLNLTAFGLLSFAVGLFIVHAAIGLAFEQRRGMFRTLRALGVSTRRLVAVLAGETLVLAILAGLLGIGLGYLVAATLLPGVAATLRGLYGAAVPGTLSLDPAWALSGFGIALAGAAAAAGQSLWQVAKLPILAPAKPRAWAMAMDRSQTRLALAALVLFAVTVVLLIFGSGLVAGFLLLGAFLLGAAFLLPWVLSRLLRLAAPLARGPITQWALADTRQQVPGLSLALMALLLALATNIGVGTMVSSFRLTFAGWLDQRLASEIYVTARDSQQSEDVRALLEGQADAVLPIRSTDIRLEGQPAQLFGVVDHPTYEQGWPLITALDTPWAQVASGQAVLINEQLWRRADLTLGSELALTADWALPIVGVYSDYGNPEGQAIVAQAELLQRFPDVSTLGYAARTDPAQVEALRAALIDIGVPAGNILNQAEVKTFSLDVFDRTFLVTAALNVLTLGVAAFAMLASLTTLAGLRLPQLAPLWAMGLTRRHLALVELARAVLFAAITWALAVPLGLILAWVLLAVVNVEAFGWRLPMFPFPFDWARLAIWAIVAALLAAALPAYRLARIAPAQLIKVFADER
ncbi:ABC transporter permease [Shimia ponticola]|uniref:ABC transporter permease n=1 Tax=Shimia ponticola TaxID=2582893 RepID=UPI0011BE5353|nr:ABC transporter permease [Shimia ponticola]